MQSLSKDQLTTTLTTIFTGGEVGTVPELMFALMAVNALPENQYVIQDPEDSSPLPGVVQWNMDLVHPEIQVAYWHGTEMPGMLGYGWLSHVETPLGRGFNLTLAGSSLQSASSLIVIPAAAYVAPQD